MASITFGEKWVPNIFLKVISAIFYISPKKDLEKI